MGYALVRINSREAGLETPCSKTFKFFGRLAHQTWGSGSKIQCRCEILASTAYNGMNPRYYIMYWRLLLAVRCDDGHQSPSLPWVTHASFCICILGNIQLGFNLQITLQPSAFRMCLKTGRQDWILCCHNQHFIAHNPHLHVRQLSSLHPPPSPEAPRLPFVPPPVLRRLALGISAYQNRDRRCGGCHRRRLLRCYLQHLSLSE
jgi:hypothetical protein